MRLFPVFAVVLLMATVVPTPASAASSSCGTPTYAFVGDPAGIDLPFDDVPSPAPLHTKCTLAFTAYSGFTFGISGDLTGEMVIQFRDPAGAAQTYWYDVVLGKPRLEREIVPPLAPGLIEMRVEVRFTEPALLGSAGAVGQWRVTVDYD